MSWRELHKYTNEVEKVVWESVAYIDSCGAMEREVDKAFWEESLLGILERVLDDPVLNAVEKDKLTNLVDNANESVVKKSQTPVIMGTGGAGAIAIEVDDEVGFKDLLKGTRAMPVTETLGPDVVVPSGPRAQTGPLPGEIQQMVADGRIQPRPETQQQQVSQQTVQVRPGDIDLTKWPAPTTESVFTRRMRETMAANAAKKVAVMGKVAEAHDAQTGG